MNEKQPIPAGSAPPAKVIFIIALLWIIGAILSEHFLSSRSIREKKVSRFLTADLLCDFFLGFSLMLVAWPAVAVWMAWRRSKEKASSSPRE